MDGIYKPKLNKSDRIRILPNPITHTKFIYKLNTNGLEVGDFVKIKDKYSAIYKTNITYTIKSFRYVYNRGIGVKLNGLTKAYNSSDMGKEIHVDFLEKDLNYYRKQKIETLLNNK